jgi:hypothetical protein
MNQYQPDQVMQTYWRWPSQAELIIPYSYPLKADESFLTAWCRSRVHRYLWDMDGPWLLSFFVSSLVSFLGLFWYSTHFLGVADLHKVQLMLMAAGISWVAMLVPFYYAIMLVNLRVSGKRAWLKAILGPTHLGLSQSGLKCYWKGGWFYNYPLLRSWANVRNVEIKISDDLTEEAVIVLSFACRISPAANLAMPLSGFVSRGDLAAFLAYLKQYVPESAYGESFESESRLDFAASLARFDACEKLLLETSNELPEST